MAASFEEISDLYRVIFFDAFGVLKSSAGVFPGVIEKLQELKERKVSIFVLTNDSSRSPAMLADYYRDSKGQRLFDVDSVISSGMLASQYLEHKLRSGIVAYLGKESSTHYVDAAGLQAVPVSQCPIDLAPKALALLDDEGFDWQQDLNHAINLLRKTNIQAFVANPDRSYPIGNGDVAIATGSLANLLESITGKQVLRFGKPDEAMFAFAFERARKALPDLHRSEVLMVGDTLETDIAGANKFGIDTALVLSGNTRPADAEVQIRASGIIPTYVCESILS